MKNPKMHFLYDPKNSLAKSMFEKLTDIYKNYSPKFANVIVALGGDGFMLKVLHENISCPLPIYGMNFGHEGFLLNEKSEAQLLEEKIKKSVKINLHPLKFEAVSNGEKIKGYAFNEIVLQRQNYQTSKINIVVDQIERIETLIGDGLLIATPAGSTGYNRAAGGEILPLTTDALTLTAICPSYPRGFKGAVCPKDTQFDLTVLEKTKRPIMLVADVNIYKNISFVHAELDAGITKTMLFDSEKSLDEKIINAQFMNYQFDCKN